MASPFCTICERLGDTEGESFLRGIPARSSRGGLTLGMFSLKAVSKEWVRVQAQSRAGLEEIAHRCVEEDAKV